MDSSEGAKLSRASKQLWKKTASITKHCYVMGCYKTPIHAHSISNKRLLLKLSENGKVAFMNKHDNGSNFVDLEEVGRKQATTFGGFCEDHDKIFQPIDDSDYEIGNIKQEFLFAMRASAKEYNTRRTANSALDKILDEKQIANFKVSESGNIFGSLYKDGLDIDVKDEYKRRSIFTDTFNKSKYNVIQTDTIVVDCELPIAVSASFYLELAPNGTIVNNLADRTARLKPWYFTVFPQNGKTYCIISYLRKDRNSFNFLDGIVKADETYKQVAISNLMTSYTENFVANPIYWNTLSDDTKERYNRVFGNSFSNTPHQFIADTELNLFTNEET